MKDFLRVVFCFQFRFLSFVICASAVCEVEVTQRTYGDVESGISSNGDSRTFFLLLNQKATTKSKRAMNDGENFRQ